jgi:hypothetical protein
VRKTVKVETKGDRRRRKIGNKKAEDRALLNGGLFFSVKPRFHTKKQTQNQQRRKSGEMSGEGR